MLLVFSAEKELSFRLKRERECEGEREGERGRERGGLLVLSAEME